VTRKQDSAKGKITAEDLKRLLAEDRDLLKTIIEETLQQVLEAEMDEALQASKGERTAGRLGYRAGYYNRHAGDAGRPYRIACAAGSTGTLSNGSLRTLSTQRESAGGGDAGDVRTARLEFRG
jgi:Transposase, Mutator family